MPRQPVTGSGFSSVFLPRVLFSSAPLSSDFSPAAQLRSRLRMKVALLAPLLWLAGCSSLDGVQRPDLSDQPLMATFQNGNQLEHSDNQGGDSATTPSAVTSQRAAHDRWWRSFADPQLDRLVEAALANSFSLQASLANLERSRALLRQSRSDQYPDVNLQAGKTRSWSDSNGNTSTSDEWNAGLNASYELDFWGSVSAAADQSRFQLYSSEAAARLQANLVASQVVNAWYGYRKEQQQLVLLSEQKQRIESGLKVINARFQRGRSQVSDVWQQQTLLESINSELIQATASRDIYWQQLQLWLGQANIDSLIGDDQSTQPGIMVQAVAAGAGQRHSGGIAMAALLRRPDVQQAWFSVQAANAGVAVAQAARYPRLTLTASISGRDASLDQVFDNWLANLAGNLVLPLIDGAERRARVAAEQASLQQALAKYQQTLLAAAQEVQQQLVKEHELMALNQSLSKQLQLAQKNEAFQSSRYAKGVGDFLALLTAQRDVLSLERQLLSNQLKALQARVGLYQAVSHGDFLPDPDGHSSTVGSDASSHDASSSGVGASSSAEDAGSLSKSSRVRLEGNLTSQVVTPSTVTPSIVIQQESRSL